jgi:3-oxoacyl-[acyl-carrier protein] reductase
MGHYEVLRNKNCFITGATGGIGAAIARDLAAKRCNLFFSSRSSQKLAELKRELEGGESDTLIDYAVADMLDSNAVADAAERATDLFGGIDILVNCAGVFNVKSVAESTIGDFESHISINLRSNFLLSKIFSEQMKQKKWGRIVNIGSSSCYSGAENTALYCMSKHGVLGFSRSLAAELKPFGIRVYCISPSGTKTEMGSQIPHQNYQTFLDPVEVAEYISFAIAFDREMVTDEISLNRLFRS